jgi:hypothetical protein
MGSKMGRAIVANASMQILLKQSTSAVDVLAAVFKLTDEERKRLAQFPVGQGLLFAGQNHVHVQIIASGTEASLISTNPGQGQPVQQAISLAQQPPTEGVSGGVQIQQDPQPTQPLQTSTTDTIPIAEQQSFGQPAPSTSAIPEMPTTPTTIPHNPTGI